MKKAKPLTPKHLAIFAHAVKKWQAILLLEDWQIHIGPKKANKMNKAEVCAEHSAHHATICVGKDFGTVRPVTPEHIEEVALHEVLHVLLHDLGHVYANHEDFGLRMAAEHRVIHTLVRLLMAANAAATH